MRSELYSQLRKRIPGTAASSAEARFPAGCVIADRFRQFFIPFLLFQADVGLSLACLKRMSSKKSSIPDEQTARHTAMQTVVFHPILGEVLLFVVCHSRPLLQ